MTCTLNHKYAYNLSVSFLDRSTVASCSFNHLINLNLILLEWLLSFPYDPMYENHSFIPWSQRYWRCSRLHWYPTLLLRSVAPRGLHLLSSLAQFESGDSYFVLLNSTSIINISGTQINLISNKDTIFWSTIFYWTVTIFYYFSLYFLKSPFFINRGCKIYRR